jgi:hypothetical protein
MPSRRTTSQDKRAASLTLRCQGGLAALAFFFGGCYGDFGRPRYPDVVTDDRRAWMSNEAAVAAGEIASAFPMTDEEKLLRDLAYPMIRPPYSRERWYFLLGEFRRISAVPYYGENYDYAAYAAALLGAAYRSASARYAQLLDDIRNDLTRVDPFLEAAWQVVDLDRKRERSLGYVSGLSVEEAANAEARVRENAMIMRWVHKCMGERAASYRYVLERLVIATPSPQAADTERMLGELDRRIAAMYRGWALAPVEAAVVTK